MKKIILTILFILINIQAYPQEKKWETLSPMPTKRYGMCSVVYEDKIWIMGGKDQNDSTLNIVECYLPFNDKWDTLNAPLQTKRFDAAAVVYHDKIYIIGGRDENGMVLNTVESLDMKNDSQWEISSDTLVNNREAHTAVVLNDTMFAIGGGAHVFDSANYLDNVEFFNEKDSIWQISDFWKLIQPRLSMATVVVNGAAYTLGGSYFGPNSLVERYSPNQGSGLRSDMLYPRSDFAAVTINDTIFVVGGVTTGVSTVNLIPAIEKYYPENDEWIQFYTDERNLLDVSRYSLTAVAFYNDIYIFGGKNLEDGPLNIVEKLKIGPTTTSNAFIKNDAIPGKFQLTSNYPNPFNASTTIPFCLPHNVEDVIGLDIFNITGQKIKSFKWYSLSSGEYNITWNGKNEANLDVTSGIYFYQLSIYGEGKIVRKMMLIR